MSPFHLMKNKCRLIGVQASATQLANSFNLLRITKATLNMCVEYYRPIITTQQDADVI